MKPLRVHIIVYCDVRYIGLARYTVNSRNSLTRIVKCPVSYHSVPKWDNLERKSERKEKRRSEIETKVEGDRVKR